MKIPSQIRDLWNRSLLGFSLCLFAAPSISQDTLPSDTVSLSADFKVASILELDANQLNNHTNSENHSSEARLAEEQSIEKQTLEAQLNTFLNLHKAMLTEKGFRSEVKIGKIAPHFVDRSCSAPISFEFAREPLENAHTTVLTQCSDTSSWKLYLKVDFKVFAPRVIARNGVARGAIIELDDLDTQEQQINKHGQQGFDALEDVAGMIAKRSIRSARLITPDLIIPPMLVERGDEVLIIASNDRISIKMKGTALNKGRKGQQISVRNAQSKRVINAYIQDKGLVSVRL